MRPELDAGAASSGCTRHDQSKSRRPFPALQRYTQCTRSNPCYVIRMSSPYTTTLISLVSLSLFLSLSPSHMSDRELRSAAGLEAVFRSLVVCRSNTGSGFTPWRHRNSLVSGEIFWSASRRTRMQVFAPFGHEWCKLASKLCLDNVMALA